MPRLHWWGSRRTFLLGDSAGGQIALSSAILLRDKGFFEQPCRLFLIAPALDAAMANPPEIPALEPRDPWLSRPGIAEYVRYWRGGLSIDDPPLVSPLSAELTGLTALTIFTGTRDILNPPDAHLLARRATAAGGVDADVIEGEGMVHVYPLLPIPEGRAARRRIVDAINGTPPRGRLGDDANQVRRHVFGANRGHRDDGVGDLEHLVVAQEHRDALRAVGP